MSESSVVASRPVTAKWLFALALVLLPGGGIVLALVAATMYFTRRIGRSDFGAIHPPASPIPTEHAP